MAEKETASAKKTEKTEDKSQTQKKDAGTTNASMPEQATEETGEKSILDRVAEALGCDADKKKIAGDAGLMAKVMSSFKGDELKEALDFLYDSVTDTDTMMEMIWVRFGVPVIDNRASTWKKLDSKTQQILNKNSKKLTPEKWTAKGLIEVYSAYIHLPQGNLDLITCLMRNKSTEASGCAYGTTSGTTGIYEINYRSGTEKDEEKFGFGVRHNDWVTDRRVGTKLLSMTAAHELGHVVDGAAGWKYSKKGSSMWNVSKWEETNNDATTVVDKMIASIKGDPYGKNMTDDERKLARKVGIRFLKHDQTTDWAKAKKYIESDLTAELKASGKKLNSTQQADLLKRMSGTGSSSLLHHLWYGQAANQSWYRHDEVMKGMSKPFHQGYDGDPWYTYDNSRWHDKISAYQYRNPKEEFAETYASYHAAPTIGKKKGENTPADLLAWFLGEGLGDKEAEEGTSNEKEVKENK